MGIELPCSEIFSSPLRLIPPGLIFFIFLKINGALNPVPPLESLAGSYGTSTAELSIEEAKINQKKRALFHSSEANWSTRKQILIQSLQKELKIDLQFPVNKFQVHKSFDLLGIEISTFSLMTLDGTRVHGNIYSPEKIDVPIAGILLPHDHSDNGRFDRVLIVLAMNLARAGSYVITWDMIGWGNTLGDHEQPDTKGRQVQHGLEIFKAFQNQSQLDKNRVGLVGFSGGAHLGILLTALISQIQTRILASMVSSLRVGNCSCELLGYPYQSVVNGTDNIELSALFEPRPQLIISNGSDWTRHFPEIGFNTISKIYSLSHHSEKIESIFLKQAGHDFSSHHRQLTYDFLEKQLKLQFTRDTYGNVNENWVPIIDEATLGESH